MLDVTVGRDGSVKDAVVHASAGEALDEAAQVAVHSWLFAPARRAGVAVASRIRISFRFGHPSATGPTNSEASRTEDELRTSFAKGWLDEASRSFLRFRCPVRSALGKLAFWVSNACGL